MDNYRCSCRQIYGICLLRALHWHRIEYQVSVAASAEGNLPYIEAVKIQDGYLGAGDAGAAAVAKAAVAARSIIGNCCWVLSPPAAGL